MNDPFEPQQETPAEETAENESSVELEDGVSYLASVEGIALDETALPVVTDAALVADEVVPAETEEAPSTETVPAETETASATDAAPAEIDAAPVADEVVPEVIETVPAATEIAPEEIVSAEILPATGARLAWWPFLLLVGFWVALAGVAAYVLTRTADLPAFEHEYYPAIVLAGVVLTVLGPVLALITWAVSPKEGERGGLFVTSIVRSSAITLFGVLMWWGVLVAVDALRLGLIKL